jgi:hypothetical protein
MPPIMPSNVAAMNRGAHSPIYPLTCWSVRSINNLLNSLYNRWISQKCQWMAITLVRITRLAYQSNRRPEATELQNDIAQKIPIHDLR